MTTANLQLIYYREQLFRRLLLVSAALFVVYIYLASSVVFNLVGRQKALDTLTKRQNEVVALESEYLTLANGITLDLAHTRGFHDAAGDTIFAPPVNRTLGYGR